MSAIGRIFIILNLILAAAFVGWAATSLTTTSTLKKDYEKQLADKQAELTALERERSDLQNQLNTEKQAKEQFRADLDAAAAERDRNAKDLAAAQRANEELRAEVSGINATLAGYNQTNAALEQAKDAAVAEARDLERQRNAAQAERDQAVTAQRDAEGKLEQTVAQVADLERALTSARKDASKLDAEIKTLVALTGVDRSAIGANAKPIEARVLQVNSDLKPGLVALNKGSQAGVTRGMTFQVYSGSTWKGQVRVESVQENMCSALIVTQKQGETISQGDSAATIL